ncbi:MAG: sulfur modification protein DndB [Chthoniobacter sp.]|jgi:DGQHR domain-containing protein|nr:sulfur modification protein DndB [Chthoniobacter sp.]
MASSKSKKEPTKLTIAAIRGKVLGVSVYRGFALLSDLSGLSKADIYDQKDNPKGTQRDLSAPHAREAHEYVRTRDLGFWPEVFLCARNKGAIAFTPFSDEWPDVGILTFDLAKIRKDRAIAVSRIDGNHRLHYADGQSEGYAKVEKSVSFCLAYDLSRDDEIQLFKDINKNQKPMNTSHLDGIEVRLTPEEHLTRRQPELYIAQKLGKDSASPLHGRIYEGGKKPSGVDIPLRAIKTGIEYMLTRSTQLPQLEDAEAQYRVIRNYFDALKKWLPKAWSEPREYIVLRGAGLWAVSFIGAHVIDRALHQAKFTSADILTILKSGKEWDWSKNGDFKGMSGRGGALEISKQVTSKLQDKNRMSTKQLFEEIMKAE